jgi:hypothetical protein
MTDRTVTSITFYHMLDYDRTKWKIRLDLQLPQNNFEIESSLKQSGYDDFVLDASFSSSF